MKVFRFLDKELLLYLLAGVITTIVDYISFALINEGLKGVMDAQSVIMTATVLSWIIAVIFAYVINKSWVFKSKGWKWYDIKIELFSFVTARSISGIISIFLMWLMTSNLLWNEYLSKVITSGFNMIANYIASKFWIFVNVEENNGKDQKR